MPSQQISRRLLLGATTAVLLTGCDDEPAAAPTASRAPRGANADPPTGSPSSGTSDDDRLVADAVASATALTGAYAGLAARHPDTRRTTAPLRAHLREHLAALGDEGRPARPAPVARSRGRAIQAVLDAERAASAARLDDAVAAASGDLARALASVAACHAQHTIVLEQL